MHRIVPVILSGGAGTRLWPLSCPQHPKPFLSGLNGASQSLLSTTLARLAPDDTVARPIVVCSETHRRLADEHAAAVGVAPQALVLEPAPRNTAPAIAVATLLAAQRDPTSILAVMPADHGIEDRARFAAAVRRAADVARKGRIVLFGIAPATPDTAYGYIRKGAPIESYNDAHEVDEFLEKPDAQTAARLLEDGAYLWNSGIFVFRSDTFLAEMHRLQPGLLALARQSLDLAVIDGDGVHLDDKSFSDMPCIAIDYAMMERTSQLAVLPLDVGWRDLGSWSGLWHAAPRDGNGNALWGDALVDDTTTCYIHADRTEISAVGVKDLVIVATPEAVLVADKSRCQDVARIAARRPPTPPPRPEPCRRCQRPWGFYETVSTGTGFQIKRLHVEPGRSLSMQMHRHRTEHWVVVRGTAHVGFEGGHRELRENQSLCIAPRQWHRLANPGPTPLELIEVQIGPYLGEDDIVRADRPAAGPDETDAMTQLPAHAAVPPPAP